MLNNLIEELRILAASILEEEQVSDVESRLDQARSLYEKLLILDHLKKESKQDELELVEEEIEKPISEQDELELIEEEIEKPISELNIENSEPDPKEDFKEELKEESKPLVQEEEPPLSLNDLFVPTFDGIKEDMSQKAEFKDTISLDETEKLFQTKKEGPRQLSLNDKLVGSSIQVGLNDRIAFVNKLFNFSQSDFNKVLSRLNDCNSKEEALKYFQYQVKPNYNWKGKEDLEERMVSLIERKYL